MGGHACQFVTKPVLGKEAQPAGWRRVQWDPTSLVEIDSGPGVRLVAGGLVGARPRVNCPGVQENLRTGLSTERQDATRQHLPDSRVVVSTI